MQITDPYLNVFRGLVPPFLGGVDFTPLLGFLIIQKVEVSLNQILNYFPTGDVEDVMDDEFLDYMSDSDPTTFHR